MKGIISLIPPALYIIVGILSLTMALKIFYSGKFLSFHEKAAMKSWDEIDGNLRYVILALMRVSGMGFFTIFILLTCFPVYCYFVPNQFLKFSVPLIAFIYCFGLFIINYLLFKSAKSGTPWKKSLMAMLLLLLGFMISIFQ
jgi:hypothetical protein